MINERFHECGHISWVEISETCGGEDLPLTCEQAKSITKGGRRVLNARRAKGRKRLSA